MTGALIRFRERPASLFNAFAGAQGRRAIPKRVQ
jgi:hypothetical protein